MKKIFIILGLLVTVLFIRPQFSFAQMGMMGNFYGNDASSSSQTQEQNKQILQAMVDSLLRSQHVSSTDKLNCSKIPQDQLDKLGDAWMDVMMPNESVHKTMDNMMGGEGSDSLANAHITMAERYLGCQTNGTNSNYGWMPMMGGGALPMMGYGGMMNGYGNGFSGSLGWGFTIVGFLFWFVAFADLILLGIFLWKKIRR